MRLYDAEERDNEKLMSECSALENLHKYVVPPL